MARHGVPIDRSVLADWMGRTGTLIAPVVDHMAKWLMADSTRLYVDETSAPVLDPGRGKTKTGYLGPFCAMTGAGTVPRHRAWCFTIGLAERANMPMKS